MNMEDLERTIVEAFVESHHRKPTVEELEKIRKDIIMLWALQERKVEG